MSRKAKESGFTCKHCHQPVGGGDREAIGTAHRNHCPSCLWPLHVGEKGPEDRESECGAGMEPIGLTTKADRHGELMLVHRCSNRTCGTIRVNRLAGDDAAPAVESVFTTSLALGPIERRKVAAAGVTLLGSESERTVATQLWGRKRK